MAPSVHRFSLMFCLNFSIETKIKTLFLISYFNLWEKRNDYLARRVDRVYRFLDRQFLTGGYRTLFRFYCNKSGKRIILRAYKGNPAEMLNHDFPNINSCFVEINIMFTKRNWLLTVYTILISSIGNHLVSHLTPFPPDMTMSYSSNILMQKLMMRSWRHFVTHIALSHSARFKTWYLKNWIAPSNIDLILINTFLYFQLHVL